MEVKTNPFYELRNRLYASAAAGCSLIAEDFRLKRAVEAFQPLSEANKVFGKLYAMCNSLLSSADPATEIIDCIALADALAVTQGTFADSSETSPAAPNEYIKPAHMTVNELEAIKEMIRKTQYNTQDFDDSFFKNIADPRLLSSFLDIAGKNGVGVANLLIQLEAIYGDTITDILFDSIDLSNDKEKGNQIRFIGGIARDKYNDKYIELAENEKNPQGVRIAAIEAMAYAPENEERLITLYKTSKGKIKNAALLALTKLNSPAAETQLMKMIEKPKSSNLEYFVQSGSKTVSDYTRSEHDYQITNGIKYDDPLHPFALHNFDMLANKKDVLDVFEKYAEIYKKDDNKRTPDEREPAFTTINAPLISNLFESDDKEYRDMIKNLYEKYPVYFSLSALVLGLVEDPENTFKKVCCDHYVYDRDAFYILSHIFATPDGWYRIRRQYNSSEEDYLNIKLFISIPDDILDFLSDTSVLYTVEEMEKLFDTGKKRAIAIENMTQRCDVFKHLLHVAPTADRARIGTAAEKYLWAMYEKYTYEGLIELLPTVTQRPLDEVLYKYLLLTFEKNTKSYWPYYLERFPVSEEVKIEQLQKVKAYIEKEYPDSCKAFAREITQVLERHGIIKE